MAINKKQGCFFAHDYKDTVFVILSTLEIGIVIFTANKFPSFSWFSLS